MKVENIKVWATPESAKGVKKLFGTIGGMKKFVDGIKKRVGDLTALTSINLSKDKFQWGEKETIFLKTIKCIFTTLPCLININYSSPDTPRLPTDASGFWISAVLFQGKECVSLKYLQLSLKKI